MENNKADGRVGTAFMAYDLLSEKITIEEDSKEDGNQIREAEDIDVEKELISSFTKVKDEYTIGVGYSRQDKGIRVI